jgi:hypothetical protein
MEIMKNVTQMKNSNSIKYKKRDRYEDDEIYWSLDDTMDLTEVIAAVNENDPNIVEATRYEGKFDT